MVGSGFIDSKSTIVGAGDPHLLEICFSFVKWTITRKQLAITHRAFFAIAPSDVKLALENSTIVARMLIGTPVLTLVAIRNTKNGSAIERVGAHTLSSRYLLRPTFDHRYATEKYSFALRHSQFEARSPLGL
jgi:hypothetical protein